VRFIGWDNLWKVIKHIYDSRTTTPHTLRAMGVVVLSMSACKGGGKGGIEDNGGVGFIGAKGKQVGNVGEFSCG